MTMHLNTRVPVLVAALFSVVACGPKTPAQDSNSAQVKQGVEAGKEEEASITGIRSIWLLQCGRCHKRVEPGSEELSEMQEAMARHKKQKRVNLTDEEWSQMAVFLSKK